MALGHLGSSRGKPTKAFSTQSVSLNGFVLGFLCKAVFLQYLSFITFPKLLKVDKQCVSFHMAVPQPTATGAHCLPSYSILLARFHFPNLS